MGVQGTKRVLLETLETYYLLQSLFFSRESFVFLFLFRYSFSYAFGFFFLYLREHTAQVSHHCLGLFFRFRVFFFLLRGFYRLYCFLSFFYYLMLYNKNLKTYYSGISTFSKASFSSLYSIILLHQR